MVAVRYSMVACLRRRSWSMAVPRASMSNCRARAAKATTLTSREPDVTIRDHCSKEVTPGL